MSGRIFISYRREDSSGFAGRLYDQLAAHFGREHIFMDVDTIQPGLDFVDAIESAVSETNVQIVVIGSGWLDVTDAAGNRRLDNPEDFIRLEVAAALERNIRVIPVLVDRATMPHSTDLPDDLKSLTRRNAIEISHTRFNSDIQRLIHALELALEQTEADHKAEAQRMDAEKAETNRIAPEKAEAERRAAGRTEDEGLDVERKGAERIMAAQTRSLWLPILLTAIGWGIGRVIGRGIAPGTTMAISTGSIGGLVTGIALGRLVPGFQWKQVLIVTIGWAFGSTFSHVINFIHRSPPFVIGSLFMATGGLVTGMVLRRLVPSFQWKQVLIVTIGWAIGGVFGWLYIFFIGWWSYYMNWFIVSAIAGALGGGVMFWQIHRMRAG